MNKFPLTLALFALFALPGLARADEVCEGHGYQVVLNSKSAHVQGNGLNSTAPRLVSDGDPEDADSWTTYNNTQFNLVFEETQALLTVQIDGHWTGLMLNCIQ